MQPPHGLTPDILRTYPGGHLLSKELTQEHVDAVVATVRKLCGWHVFPVATTEYSFPWRGDPEFLVPTKRLVSVESVTCGDLSIPNEDIVFYPYGEVNLLRRVHGTPWRVARPMTVTMTHGYEDAPGLVGVIAQMLTRAFTSTGGGDGNLTVGNMSYGLSTGITPKSSEWLIIDQYRLHPV